MRSEGTTIGDPLALVTEFIDLQGRVYVFYKTDADVQKVEGGENDANSQEDTERD